MTRATGGLTFRGVLFLFALFLLSSSFLSGELFIRGPNNWFLAWLGGIFMQMEKVGFFNVWTGHSQATNYLFFVLWQPARILAGEQWYFAMVFWLLWFVFTTVALFLSFYLFYKIAERLWGEQRALSLGIGYIFISMAFQWHIILKTVLDPVTVALLLAAIYYSLQGRTVLGGMLLGASAAIKPIGLVMLPVLWKSDFLSRKARVSFVVACLAVFVALLLPFALGNWKIFLSTYNWQNGRPPWGTPYAFALWLLKKPYPNDSFFQDYSGIQPVDWGWTGITPLHSILTTPVPAYNPWYSSLSLALMAAALGGFLLAKRVRTPRDLLWGVLYSLSIYFAVFFGWSPQFFSWLLPFLLASFPLTMPVALGLLVFLEYPFFYGLYLSRVVPHLVSAAPELLTSFITTLSPLGVPGYWGAILLRTAILLTIVLTAWRKLPTALWAPSLLRRRQKSKGEVRERGIV